MLNRVFAAAFISVALCASLSAQVSTAEIVGVVTDSSGASIANAKVSLTNKATSISRDTTTDQAGNYIFTLIQPGDYNLGVEATGFKKAVQSDLNLQVNQRARIDIALQVGQVSETLEVAATAPLLESQSSSLGSVIAGKFVSDLPLNGRNFVSLAILSPGVNGTGFTTAGTIQSGARPDDRRPGTEIVSNGNREGSNNFLFDGVDNNERLIQLIVYRPAVESIREFKVQTNMYSADLGRNSGAVVDVISKSGTNDFHGSAFEFLRNSAMDARGFFNAKGTPFPPFRWNQYGFSLGGPVLFPKLYNGRNKTFFFVDYEGYKRNFLNSSVRTVPTLKIRDGDFTDEQLIYDPVSNRPAGSGFTRTQFPGNRIPRDRWDPATTKLLNAFPLPGSGGRTNNYLANLNQTQNWHQGDVRVDHQITPNDNFFARWSIQHTTTFAPYTFPAANIPDCPNRSASAMKIPSPVRRSIRCSTR